MNTNSDSDMELPTALIWELRDCLIRLDSLGANTAAAHVDAAIHALLGDLENRVSSDSE